MKTPEDIELLLPFYATGRLTAAERSEVAAALRADPTLRRQLELIEEEAEVARDVSDAVAPLRPESLDGLLAQVSKEPRKVPWHRQLDAALSRIMGPSPLVARIAVLALVAVVAVQAVALFQTRGHGAGFVPATGETAATVSDEIVLVAFDPALTVAEVVALLERAEARVIAGPAGGIFTLAVTDTDAAIAVLDGLPGITFVGQGG